MVPIWLRACPTIAGYSAGASVCPPLRRVHSGVMGMAAKGLVGSGQLRVPAATSYCSALRPPPADIHEIAETESAEIAEELITQSCHKGDLDPIG